MTRGCMCNAFKAQYVYSDDNKSNNLARDPTWRAG